MTINVWDTVRYKWLVTEYLVSDITRDGDEVRIVNRGWIEIEKLEIVTKAVRKKMNIGGYDCIISTSRDELKIAYKNHLYTVTFFGDVDVYIKTNRGAIVGYFANKIDIEVKAIMEEFTSSFDNTIVKLKQVVLPHTKDMLLWYIVSVFKVNISKVANLFSDSSIKGMLISLFK